MGQWGISPLKRYGNVFFLGQKNFFFLTSAFSLPFSFFALHFSFSLKAERSRKRENQSTMLLSITHSSFLKQKFKIEFTKEILLFAQYNTCNFFFLRLSLLVDSTKNKPSWIRDYLSKVEVYCFLQLSIYFIKGLISAKKKKLASFFFYSNKHLKCNKRC